MSSEDEGAAAKLAASLGTWPVTRQEPIIPKLPEIDFERIARAKNETAGRYDAEGVFNYLMDRVNKFQASLDAKHEVAIQLANFGIPEQFHIRKIGYQNPNLIEFTGMIDENREIILVQHISQLSFLLIAVSPLIENAEPYRVGFK